jgi:APA family basic amino acid/polyamine antiporter
LYLRYSKPDMKRDFECPFMPFVPLAGMSLFLLILCGLPLKTFIHAGCWIAVLLGVYFLYGRHNSLLLHPKKKRD